MPIKYLSGESTGVQFTLYETRTVVVTNEAIDPTSGYEGDTVVYTAIVKDNTGAVLPSSFVVSLVMNGTTLISNQQLTSDVYDSTSGELTLTFTVPSVPAGTYTVKLTWNEQII